MTGVCQNPYCFIDDGGSCHLGLLQPKLCPDLAKNSDAEDSASDAVGPALPQRLVDGQILLPWTSNALGTIDLAFVAARSQPVIVGVIGPHKAGKTTILAALYLQLGAGVQPKCGRKFAGSFSLGGWEAVAHALRWSNDSPPSFPPHTPLGAQRAPGMLHLAFRDDRGQMDDLFFADSPGEWFSRWAVKKDAPDADSARWLAERTSVFLLVADCEALNGETRGQARSELRQLAERLAERRAGRPVALVWAKADVAIADTMATAVRNAVLNVIPDAEEFRVTVAPGHEADPGYVPLLNWILTCQQPSPMHTTRRPPPIDPFLAFGR